MAETRDRSAKKEPDQPDSPDQLDNPDKPGNPVVEVGTDPVFVREQVGTVQLLNFLFFVTI